MRVSVLGEQAIVDDESGSVRTRSSRAVIFVAFLALHAGSPQPRQRIAGLFWPDSTDAQALTNLRRELHYLRQVLGDDPSLIVTSRDLCWRDAGTCRVDLRVFDTERKAALVAAAAGDDHAVAEHAAAAMAEYRGDLLPGADDDWLLDARAVVRRQCVDLCDVAAAARIRSGDLGRAVDVVRRRLQLEPLEEAGYRTLMQLQADLGDRAGAISTYHHCAAVLERELGVLPDAATRKAFQRLVAHAGPPEGPAAGAGRGSSRLGPAAVPLIGRSGELAMLEELWQAALAGQPGIVLVRGSPGVGKTRLVAEVAGKAGMHGAVVVSTQCFGAPGRVALAPVADWLRNPAVQSAAAALDPVWRAEVGRLVPAGGHGAPASGARAMADAWQRHRFFEGLARALHAVGRPLLLVLDNLQWCDQETLAFVAFCLALTDRAELLVAGTARGDGRGDAPDLADWIVQMRATGLLAEFPLSPLEADDTARLARAVSGQPLAGTDAELLHATTGGFPLFVIEAVRSSANQRSTPLPSGDLSSVLRKRLEQPSAPAREVAGLAAAAGTYVTLDLLTEASDLDADTVVGAVDELWLLRILREFRDGYDFSHDLLRETAYAGVNPARRWLLHRRIAQGLELLHADDTAAIAGQLADQYARGRRPERAVDYYRRAADVAAGTFAHAEAIRLLKKALGMIEDMPAGRDRDSRELAVLEQMAAPLNARYGYSSLELQRALERVIALAETLGRNDSMVKGLVALWGTRFVQGHTAHGYELTLRALALAEPESELSAQAHFGAGGSAVSLGMPAEAIRHLELAAKLAPGALWMVIGTRADVHAMAWSAHAHWLLGRSGEALSSCQEAIELARSIHHPYSLAIALAYGSITHQMRHDTRELRKTVDELRRLCGQYDFAYYREWALVLDGWSRADDSGIDLARQGIRNLRSEGSLARMPYWLALLADLFARNHRPDQARATLDAAIATGNAHQDVWWLPEVMRMRAAYDGEQAVLTRLREAAQLASAHGSAGLLHRCEQDLAAARSR
jgi:DNA-binding SARP family transcriptional activator/tetratricopeptide (TPR) repeat protein